MKHFSLTNEQEEKINEWLINEVYPNVIERQKKEILQPTLYHKSCWKMGIPWEGAIGGGLTYSFTPTSLGIIEHVIYAQGTDNEKKLDLTDYDYW